MEQETIFKIIHEQLLPVLNQFTTTGSAEISIDTKLALRDVYRAINPQVGNMDLACQNCILHYLSIASSWAERQYPLFLASQMKHQAEVSAATATTITAPAHKKRITKKKP